MHILTPFTGKCFKCESDLVEEDYYECSLQHIKGMAGCWLLCPTCLKKIKHFLKCKLHNQIQDDTL